MKDFAAPPLDALNTVLDALGSVAVAVSGGVDSLTLAQAAHRRLGAAAEMIHAVSPAVPAEATARTRALAEREGWALKVVDAGEFADEQYLANPVNRCFFCKSSLYRSLATMSDRIVVSGANTDDLGDYRPGMEAAADHGVRHPFIEAGIAKGGVRAIARTLGLDGIAELPASPCLSSRIETGIPVTPEALDFVHEVETRIGGWLAARGGFPGAVRCRIRHNGPAVELDAASLAMVLAPAAEALRRAMGDLAAARGYGAALPFEPYRMGSAFLKEKGA